jgi:hypothetical protein
MFRSFLKTLAIAAWLVLPFGSSTSGQGEKASRAPVGKWTQVAADGVHDLNLTQDKLVWTWRPNEKGDTVRMEAAFHVTQDSFLFAFITFIEGKVKGGPEEEVTFAFRFRFDDEHLTVKDIKGHGFDHPMFKSFAGRYERTMETHPSLKYFNDFEADVRTKARKEVAKAKVPKNQIFDQCERDLAGTTNLLHALEWLAQQPAPENQKKRAAIAMAAEKHTFDKYPAVRANAARLLLKWGEPVDSRQALLAVLDKKDPTWADVQKQAKHLLDHGRPVDKQPKQKQEERLIRILFIEGSPRYEYRFCRSALERNKLVGLKVLLLDADKEAAKTDRIALADFPSRAELKQFDVIIIGDVDPAALGKEKLTWIADFVKEHNGGVLFLAGRQFSPRAFQDTPLSAILPVEVTGKAKDGKEPESFRLDSTEAGRKSLLRFDKDDKKSQDIVNGLPALHWFAEGYKPRAKAEVLAVHPTAKIDGTNDPLPLIVGQTVGTGRALFFGIEETWRWRFRELEPQYNHFWLQTIRYLAKLPPLDKARHEPADQPAKGLITMEAQKAIDEGLAYLAKNQAKDGSWGTGQHAGNVGITSLAALAFLAAGHQPGQGPYGDKITKAIKYVLDHEDRDVPGLLNNRKATSHGPMYSHGFATLFLAEVYGTIPERELRAPVKATLSRAVKLTIMSQNNEGGWRYQPRPADADITATVCQVQALRAAAHAGCFIPKATVDKAVTYIKACQDVKGSGGFNYQQQFSGFPGFARTASGTLALMSAGLAKSDEALKGLLFLAKFKPGKAQNDQDLKLFFYYGHYYAGQAKWLAGGLDGRDWFTAVRDELLRPDDRLNKDGGWNDPAQCRHMCTAMALCILQLPNNYLPMCDR